MITILTVKVYDAGTRSDDDDEEEEEIHISTWCEGGCQESFTSTLMWAWGIEFG